MLFSSMRRHVARNNRRVAGAVPAFSPERPRGGTGYRAARPAAQNGPAQEAA
jgi:hypothetical protein